MIHDDASYGAQSLDLPSLVDKHAVAAFHQHHPASVPLRVSEIRADAGRVGLHQATRHLGGGGGGSGQGGGGDEKMQF